jgi:hypothetical protein
MQCPAGQCDPSRVRDGVSPIPAPDLHDMNRSLIEWTACIDRHDLIRLAADHDLIVWPGRKVVISM